MGKQDPTATTPAASGVEIDYDQLAHAITEANKPVLDAVGKLATPAATEKKEATTEKPLTLADVQKAISDSLSTAQTTAQQQQARERFQADKLKDLPAAYRHQLGSDPAKWAAEEQTIRDAFKADFQSLGLSAADVGGNKGGGTTVAAPGAAVNTKDLSATQSITLGLQSDAAGAGAGSATTK